MTKKNTQIYVKLKKPKASTAFDIYWKFAAERQSIFFKRLSNHTNNYTNDPILSKHKFTNAYRASDRVSQFLIRDVIYNGSQKPSEVFFRILLFKTFNKIATWEILIGELKEISYKSYLYSEYSKILDKRKSSGKTIYSAAYIMSSGKSFFGYKYKHQNHLKLIEMMMQQNTWEEVTSSKSMENVFNILKGYPTIGNFLAYQYSIDINYSGLTSFSEMDFVMPGPGAKDGIKKCFIDFGDFSESDIIKFVADIQFKEFERLGLEFQDLWGRPLQLIDCQNLFCEVDKYLRVYNPKIKGLSEKKRIKQLFNPNKTPINFWYPPKWEINNKIKNYE